jgi:hypothetical protein
MMTYPEDEIENQLTGELSHYLTIGDSNQFHKSHIHREKSIFIFKNESFELQTNTTQKQMRRFICV